MNRRTFSALVSMLPFSLAARAQQPLRVAADAQSNEDVQSNDHVLHTFKKIKLTDEYWSEAATIGDIDCDGQMEVIVPPFWYKVSLINPAVYLISGFRWSFYEHGDVSLAVSVTMITVFAVTAIGIIAWIFKTGYRLRT